MEGVLVTRERKGGAFLDVEALEVFSRVAAERGCAVYDVEAPKAAGGVVRLSIFKGHPRENLAGLDDCVEVTRAILRSDEEERKLFDDSCSLEVSTPGINRALKTKEHFEEAVGERVKVSFVREGKKESVVGQVVGVDGEVVKIEPEVEKSSGVVEVFLSEISSGRVDFPFD